MNGIALIASHGNGKDTSLVRLRVNERLVNRPNFVSAKDGTIVSLDTIEELLGSSDFFLLNQCKLSLGSPEIQRVETKSIQLAGERGIPVGIIGKLATVGAQHLIPVTDYVKMLVLVNELPDAHGGLNDMYKGRIIPYQGTLPEAKNIGLLITSASHRKAA